jgi:RNA polymerase sigma factor (sigma-70 family)
MALAVVARPTDQDTDDLDLVAGVRAGDERAFELLYLRYHGRIAAYVRSMVRDHGRAEDITQEIFISALRRMRETDREIAFKPWMYEIAKNACIDAFRRSRQRNEVSFDAHDALGAGDHDRLAGMGARPDTAVDTKADLDNLRGAFGGLSEVHHQILVMRELEGLSYRAIGERLGMSRPAVESTLFRARRRLGEEYEELVSGKRCLRVRAIVDAAGRSAGVRDQRRMDRHISHCQPCRRYALAAGVDLDSRRPLRPAAAKIAALLPLPAIVRRRVDGDAAQQLLGSPGHATFAQCSANIAGNVDPATLAGWSKAVFAAASIAVAGVGAGAAITEREALSDFVSRAPAMAGFGDADGAAAGGTDQAGERQDARRRPAAGGAQLYTRSGGALGLSTGFSRAFAAPDSSAQPLTRDRNLGPANDGGAGRPTDPGKSQGAALRDAGVPDAIELGPVDELLQAAPTIGPGAGGGEPSTTTPNPGPPPSVADIPGAAASTLSDVVGTDAPDASSSQPVADVALPVTITVDAAPPGT